MLNDLKKQQIENKVRSVISQAKTWSKVEPQLRQEKELVNNFLAGQINIDEFSEQIRNYEDEIGTIHFYSVSEFIFALQCFKASQQQIDSILKEQLPNYEQGKDSYLPTRLSITPYRTERNQLILIPGVQNRIDRLMKEEAVRAALLRMHSFEQNLRS